MSDQLSPKNTLSQSNDSIYFCCVVSSGRNVERVNVSGFLKLKVLICMWDLHMVYGVKALCDCLEKKGRSGR